MEMPAENGQMKQGAENPVHQEIDSRKHGEDIRLDGQVMTQNHEQGEQNGNDTDEKPRIGTGELIMNQ